MKSQGLARMEQRGMREFPTPPRTSLRYVRATLAESVGSGSPDQCQLGENGVIRSHFLDGMIRLASRCFYGLRCLSKKPTIVGILGLPFFSAHHFALTAFV